MGFLALSFLSARAYGYCYKATLGAEDINELTGKTATILCAEEVLSAWTMIKSSIK